MVKNFAELARRSRSTAAFSDPANRDSANSMRRCRGPAVSRNRRARDAPARAGAFELPAAPDGQRSITGQHRRDLCALAEIRGVSVEALAYGAGNFGRLFLRR